MNQPVHRRQPAVAGSFYPANPADLAAMLHEMRTKADKLLSGRRNNLEKTPMAIVVPHAGYVYSGVVAAAGFAAAANGKYNGILLIAPSHRVGFYGVAIGTYTKLATPVGDIDVDLQLQNKIAALADRRMIHLSDVPLKAEHAMEVELPMIQEFFPDMPVVPLITGQFGAEQAEKIAGRIAGVIPEDYLMVISSDFTHYGRDFNYLPFTGNVRENLKKLDLEGAEKIASGNVEDFQRFLDRTGATICGAAGIMLAMAVINKNYRKTCGRIICYTNSGELTGDFSHAVGYCTLNLYGENI